MPTETREDGILCAVAGASRWGKTGWVKQQLAAADRLLIWDPRGEYIARDSYGWPGCQRVESIPTLARLLIEAKTGPGRFAFWGPKRDFDNWCRLAYRWTQYAPAVLVGEEISDNTSAGKAPEEWGELIRKGLYYGAHIFAITQRPAETDKTTWGNASVVHSHGFTLPRDQAYMAQMLGVTVEEVAALRPLDFLERHAGDTEVKRGRLGG